jgi:hypothetical protein
MFDANDPDAPESTSSDHRSRKAVIGVSLAAMAGLIVASQTVLAAPAPALVPAASGHRGVTAAALVPPAGKTWIEGIVTDQANHGQDNVNVEAWPGGPGATTPAASSLTYGGAPSDPRFQHGFFLLEVPSNQPYRIVLSTVGGKEDGDPFRMKSYGHGRPIVVRTAVSAAGRIRNLGTIALARQGRVASTTKAVLPKAKVAAGTRAKLRVRVTSRFVTHVTGKVVVRAGGKKLTHRLTARSHGTSTFKLPHLKKPGRYKVTASFTGSGTVHRSKAKPVKLTVRK